MEEGVGPPHCSAGHAALAPRPHEERLPRPLPARYGRRLGGVAWSGA